MVVLPYLPSPLARSIPQIRQTELRLTAFGSIKPDLRFAWYSGPRHTKATEETRARPINVQ